MRKKSKNETAICEANGLYQIHEVEIIYQSKSIRTLPQVKNSQDTYAILKQLFDLRKIDYKEEFYVILLNRANYIIGVSRIGVGATTGVAVNIKEIFQLVLKSNACSLILSHNHPSGNTMPSEADFSLTQKVKKGCELMDIQLLDHLIVSSESYYSIADEGLL